MNSLKLSHIGFEAINLKRLDAIALTFPALLNNYMTIANWIYEENLKPLLETLSCFVGYSFDESDWVAVSTGIINTNDEEEK